MRAFYLAIIRLMIIGTFLILIMSHFTTYTSAIKCMEPSLYELKEKAASIQEKGDERDDHSKN